MFVSLLMKRILIPQMILICVNKEIKTRPSYICYLHKHPTVMRLCTAQISAICYDKSVTNKVGPNCDIISMRDGAFIRLLETRLG